MKSHRFLLRLPEVLHQRALKKAASSDKSLNQFIEDAVTGAVSRAETISMYIPSGNLRTLTV
jgi:predicted HicB family RNase H-like nuclease